MPLPKHRSLRIESDIVIDGDLTKDLWRAAESVRMHLYSGTAPTYQTRVRSMWNDRHLYFAFESEDPEPVGTMTRRDDTLFEDGNVVEVMIDPAGDGKSYFEFEVNPLATLMDLFFDRINREWREALKWNARDARTAVRVQRDPTSQTPIGWTTELCVPLDNFHTVTKPRVGDVWRVNYYRYNTVSTLPGKHLELYAWSPTITPKFDQPDKFGFLEFIEGTMP